MNILIVGEYSGLAKNLKDGFKQLGHSVVVVQNGDDFKKIKADSNDISYRQGTNYTVAGVQIRKSHIIKALIDNPSISSRLKKIGNIELIVVINHHFVTGSLFYSGVDIKYIKEKKKNGAKIIYICCGDDPSLRWNHVFGSIKYGNAWYPDGANEGILEERKVFDTLICMSDVIIPIGYEYYDSIIKYAQNKGYRLNISDSIPVPVIKTEFEFNSCLNRRVVIFHGVNREKEKGTSYFVEAMNLIKKNYPDKVEVIINKRMPYEEYLKCFKRIDILLDQTNTYAFGINAAIGLMNGKVVFSGNEKENEECLKLGKIPIINCIPDKDDIYNKIYKLISNPKYIDDLKHASRQFAVNNLSSEVIALRYLNLVGY